MFLEVHVQYARRHIPNLLHLLPLEADVKILPFFAVS
jgi:hypothetical protein